MVLNIVKKERTQTKKANVNGESKAVTKRAIVRTPYKQIGIIIINIVRKERTVIHERERASDYTQYSNAEKAIPLNGEQLYVQHKNAKTNDN